MLFPVLFLYRKQNYGKGKLETFRTQSLFKNGYPVELPSCIELLITKQVIRL